ncbi:MAG: response regulator [Thermodesulfobacteriota bacterium]
MQIKNKEAGNGRESATPGIGMRRKGGLRRRLLLWFLLISLVPLTIVSFIGYYSAKDSLREAAYPSLSANAEAKAAFIENWFKYRFIDLESQATNTMNARFLGELHEAQRVSGQSPEKFVRSKTWQAIVEKRARDLQTFRKLYGYYDVFLIDAEGNILFTLTREDDLGTNLFNGPLANTSFSAAVRKTLGTGQEVFSDLERYPPSNNAIAGFFTDIIRNKENKNIGVFAFQVTPEQIEYAIQKSNAEHSGTLTYVVGFSENHDGITLRSKVAGGGQYEDILDLSKIWYAREGGTEDYLDRHVNTRQTRLWMAEHGQDGANIGEHEETGFVYKDPGGLPVLGIHQTVTIGDIEWGVISEIPTYMAFAPARRLLQLVLGLILLTTVLVVVIVRSTTRRIVQPILRLSEAAALVAGGDLGGEIAIESSDEIGDLGSSFNSMLHSLREHKKSEHQKEWFQSGQVELSAVMSGNQDLAEHSRKIITFLATYLGAEVGAIYTADDDKALTLQGSYAYPRGKQPLGEIQYGTGLVGQAALGRERILLTEVPEDYLPVRSALGEAAPHAIVLKPFMREDHVMGVIELATLGTFSEKALKFLDLVSEHIAISMQTFLDHIKVQELLEHSQAQTEELQAQQEELRVTNEELMEQKKKLVKRNREAKRASHALEKKSADLELTTKYKTEFLANMSHELRTPLNSMLILSKLLLQNKEGNLNEKQREFSETIHRAGLDLLELINEVLDLSKIEAGKMDVHVEKMDLKSLSAYVSKNFRHVAEDKGLTLTVELEEGLPALDTDRQRLEQILKNLLSNALKFTSRGGVTVSIGRPGREADLYGKRLERERAVAITVADTGPGIAPEKQKLIFAAFQQEDGTTSRKYGGTGLGLTISRELASLLQGRIHLESVSGKGSAFTLIVPEDPGPELSHGQRGHARGDAGEAEKTSSKSREESSSSGAAEEPVWSLSDIIDDRRNISGDDKSVLIIEDDPRFTKILIELAREKGFKGIVAGEGKTGLHLAEYYRPSAIILDIGLPDIEGREVLKKLKGNPRTLHIPVHVISAMDISGDVLEKGAAWFISKPASLEELDMVFNKIKTRVGEAAVKRVLVLEGDGAERKKIAGLIGHDTVLTSATGTCGEAYKMLSEFTFDCIILGLNLPDNSSVEFLRKLNDDKAIIKPPVIIYTDRDLSSEEEDEFRKYTERIIIKSERSLERLLDETTLFLHLVDSEMPADEEPAPLITQSNEDIFPEKKVLIVDDDMRNIFALSSVLESKGMEVLTGKNGREALDCLNNNGAVDLVLMDIMMPEMDGYEAMREIRKIKKLQSLPLIALTAKAMKGDRDKCIEAGANDYIAKPVDTDRLFSIMRVWLSQ